jgi:hypothetical protein
MVVVNVPEEGEESILWEDGDSPLISSDRPVDGAYYEEPILWWYRDGRVIKKFKFSQDCDITSVAHRDDRLFISLYEGYEDEFEQYHGIWAKLNKEGHVRMFKASFWDYIPQTLPHQQV